ncbi:NLP/P60 protein [Paenibacillus mucilaginosus 3016]|uniref:NLP/P60 protein n=2 Tax=Paenibacillus mucilaginosus TaxID=61624 RepID=H6N9U9_9BACL|nr:NlpC/P60 family protein [Paenibacillus mucilaginosus]AFC28477.1 NLP/P60 protein [Paenibacillus mucilaginosus 3016]AFH60572.1 hydrolase Nlp/P60 [Paenibacillus mucilaginosus K02]AFK65421.1 NLP/P60 protein [Paenibacillus mucilaginosus K02]WFA17273.1 hydrolase Nlp/P60 [Paenibacillus mucilaginosus]
MKKATNKMILLTAAAAVFVTANPALVPAAQAAETATVYTTLYQGMTSDAVSQLQRDLKTLGYFVYPTITNYYGTVTAGAVRAFQTAYSLPVTGTADPVTRERIAFALVRKAIVADSYQYLRVPYKWGGATPEGFDCSGFVYFMFTKHGVPLTRTTSAAMFTMGTAVDKAKLVPGDLVFFSLGTPGVASHMGIYVGNGQFISALSSVGIYVQNMNNTYWGPKYLGARRF